MSESAKHTSRPALPPVATDAAERSHAMAEQSSEAHPEENYEDVTVYDLDADVEEELLMAHNECTFIWANREGWPVGVIMSYVWRDGRFWLTASSQRARISAVRRDPRVCVVVTSTGSPMPRNKAITWKGTCTVHDDAETKAWFYPALAEALWPRNEAGQAAFVSFLDSPRRVILEVEPMQRIGYDGSKMAKATADWLATRSD
ncbi:pyridoxamine 5'-phosphate oxidase family protein [Candidatus Poriferisodalis sp.]|uniref:pyridoxamine 5'-phosphate oxidase family protein n=1 Tax=Candidatus Poriferisodalis sp. TaxID=3101277 RepID=UPI003B02DDAA